MNSIVGTIKRLMDQLLKDLRGSPKPPSKEDFQKGLYENTDTARDIDAIFDEKGNLKAPPAPMQINDEDYWWCFKGNLPLEPPPLIEALDPIFISAELNRKIDHDEFPVIEIPNNVMRTLQILNNPNFDYAEVAALVNHSPAMAGEFIRVINSSMFSRGVEISDLKLALPRLGRENTKALLYMYSSKMCFVKDPLFNELAVSIVDHSYAVGLIASYLSQRFYPDPDGAFLAGLLHDIGKLGILKAISDNFEMPEEVDVKITDELFDNIFPHLHERAGKFLAGNWRINDTVISSIEHHHDFMDTPFGEDDQMGLHLSCIVNVADTMARVLGYGRSIGPVNVLAEPATIDLAMEKDYETIKFLDEIPRILSFKPPPSARKNDAPQPSAEPAKAKGKEKKGVSDK